MENIISVSVLVFQDEDILFLKSDTGSKGVKLVFPGGKVKDDENIEECAVREVRESAGVTIELDKKLSGVITRRNKQGNYLITFIFLAEAIGRNKSVNAVYIPYKDVDKYREISMFSKLIVKKLKVSSLSGMDRSEFEEGAGKSFIMYF